MRVDGSTTSALRLLLVAIALALATTTASAQTTAELFDSATLHDLTLRLHSRDVESIRATYLENTYYTADLEWRGITVRNVGVRSRGTGSRNPLKPGLKIEFDHYVTGQRFLGLSSLVLDNLWQDPALIREGVTMALFERMGQPTPRESYARLFINGEYQGVYALVEAIDPQFLARVYNDAQGYLFEYEWTRPYYGEYLGASLPAYRTLFKPDAHVAASDSELFSPVEMLFRDVSDTTSATWFESVARDVDVAQLITHVAVEQFVSELDGLLGYAGMNNFYLYRPGAGGPHQFIVWDRDNAFQDVQSPIFLRAEENALFRAVLANDSWRALYLATLEQCARVAKEDDWLENVVLSRAALIADAVHADGRKQFSNEAFDAGVQELLAFARVRPGVVSEQVSEQTR